MYPANESSVATDPLNDGMLLAQMPGKGCKHDLAHGLTATSGPAYGQH